VESIGERRSVYRVLEGKPRGKSYLEDQGLDRMIILRWIFKKWDGGARTGYSWLRIGKVGGHLRLR
jgi:hypothetical protein